MVNKTNLINLIKQVNVDNVGKKESDLGAEHVEVMNDEKMTFFQILLLQLKTSKLVAKVFRLPCSRNIPIRTFFAIIVANCVD